MNKHSITLSLHTLIAIIAAAAVLIVGAVTLVINWDNWFGDEPAVTDTVSPDIDPNAGAWQGTAPQDNGCVACYPACIGRRGCHCRASEKRQDVKK